MPKLKSTYYRKLYTHTTRRIEFPKELLDDLYLFIPVGFLGPIIRRLVEKLLASLIINGFDAIEELFSEDKMQVKDIVKSLRDMTQEELVEKIQQIRHDRKRERPGAKRHAKVVKARSEAHSKKNLIDMFAGLSPEEQLEVLKGLEGDKNAGR